MAALLASWDILVFILAAAIAGVAVWKLNLHVHPTVAAVRHNLRVRGKIAPKPMAERFAERLPELSRFIPETRTEKLLAMAGMEMTPSQFWGRTLALAMGGLVAVLALDLIAIATGGQPPIAPWLGLAVGVGLALLSYFSLPRAARRRQARIGFEVEEMFDLLGIITGASATAVETTLINLSECVRDGALYPLLHNKAWERLINESPLSESHLYALIGEEYDVPAFRSLADVVRSSKIRGMTSMQRFTSQSRASAADRLSAIREDSKNAENRIRIPIVFLVLAIIALIGAPLVAVFVSGMRG